MRLHVDVGLSLRGTRHLVEGLVTVWDFPTAIHVMQLRPDRPVIIWGVLQGRHSYDLLLLPATSSPSGESPAPVTAKNGTKETAHNVTNPLMKKLSRWEYFLVTVALITVFAMCDRYKESIYWHVTCWLITCHVAWTFFCQLSLDTQIQQSVDRNISVRQVQLGRTCLSDRPTSLRFYVGQIKEIFRKREVSQQTDLTFLLWNLTVKGSFLSADTETLSLRLVSSDQTMMV